MRMIYPRIRLYSNSKDYLISLFRIFFPYKRHTQLVALEKELKTTFDRNIVLVNQARLGIYLVLKNLRERQEKKYVIVSSYTLFSVINMVVCAGCIPIFVDTKKDRFEFDQKEVMEATEEYDVLAIIVTHYEQGYAEIFNLKKTVERKKYLFN